MDIYIHIYEYTYMKYTGQKMIAGDKFNSLLGEHLRALEDNNHLIGNERDERASSNQ